MHAHAFRQDHPRLCGEKVDAWFEGTLDKGSPPPMRGKDHRTDVQGVRRWDHPRLCGEKDLCRVLCPRHTGITPAYAGKRLSYDFSYTANEDHPRLCGEKYFRRDAANMDIGSPPPMRGKVDSGKQQGRRQWDHPRLCGEKRKEEYEYIVVSGSPPPMRGKGFYKKNSESEHRITPAYAGKSAGAMIQRAKYRDHPRLCGEKQKQPMKVFRKTGSPPPMRGKGHLQLIKPQPAGITPAYAGKSIFLILVCAAM